MDSQHNGEPLVSRTSHRNRGINPAGLIPAGWALPFLKGINMPSSYTDRVIIAISAIAIALAGVIVHDLTQGAAVHNFKSDQVCSKT